MSRSELSELQCREKGCLDKPETLVMSGRDDHYEAYVCTECGVVASYAVELVPERIYMEEDAPPRTREDETVRQRRKALNNSKRSAYQLSKSARTQEQRDDDRREFYLTKAGRFFDNSGFNSDELRACTLDLFRRYQIMKPRCVKLHIIVGGCVVEAADRVSADSSITSAVVAEMMFHKSEKQKATTNINRAHQRIKKALKLVEVPRWTRIKRFVESLCQQVSTNKHEEVRINAQLRLTHRQFNDDSALTSKLDKTIACGILVAAIGKQPRTTGPTISPASLSKVTGISNASIGNCVRVLKAIGVSLSDCV